jgi:hypothetical protein
MQAPGPQEPGRLHRPRQNYPPKPAGDRELSKEPAGDRMHHDPRLWRKQGEIPRRCGRGRD